MRQERTAIPTIDELCILFLEFFQIYILQILMVVNLIYFSFIVSGKYQLYHFPHNSTNRFRRMALCTPS